MGTKAQCTADVAKQHSFSLPAEALLQCETAARLQNRLELHVLHAVALLHSFSSSFKLFKYMQVISPCGMTCYGALAAVMPSCTRIHVGLCCRAWQPPGSVCSTRVFVQCGGLLDFHDVLLVK